VRSYLTSASNHGLRAIDAIHNALTGNPLDATRHHCLIPTSTQDSFLCHERLDLCHGVIVGDVVSLLERPLL
jgi:hypothetical protein